MTFRRRLTIFFLLIVVLPIIALAVVVTELSGESRTGKADARLAAGLEAALSLQEAELDRSARAARELAREDALATALRTRAEDRIRAVTRRLYSEHELSSLSVHGRGGNELAETGSGEPVAVTEVTLRSRDGALGAARASTISAGEYAERVWELTGEHAAVLIDGRPAASTIELSGSTVPRTDEAATVDPPGGEDDLRVATVPLGGAAPGLRLALFGPIDTAGFATTRPVVAGLLIAFFALALVLIVMLVRSLQGQIGAMLGAARRIGDGDFSRELPVEGRDEMAGLASEFNKMSDRLAQQMSELREQRAELEQSIRRIGEAFAHGLDREALLDLVAETARAACEAESARIVLTGRARFEAEAGTVADGDVGAALRAVERAAMHEGRESEHAVGDAHALARPLTGIDTSQSRLGVIAIARHGPRFDSGQRELFGYLAGQASVSVENIDLHEVVSEQAITDELTGLSNPRRFRGLIEKEASRAERFGHPLSLLILDIDDFKQVNDTYGHLQGDEVLRTMGRILLEESRGVDEPARYGGEEFVLALPETGTDGALEVAERVRARVEAVRIPLVDGSGAIRVTASLGVATMPDSTREVRGLIAAADAALYRAKGAGKNRAEQAAASDEPSWAGAAQGEPAERRT
jgi:diguanylate cyclase (GGDEF)-like protein